MLSNKTQTLLKEIETQLKKVNLWAVESPSEIALASSAPFACDVMPFEHWLQFIFLPKMYHLVECQSALPANIALTPMAEHVWPGENKMQPLIDVLHQLDRLLNAPR